jgi:hypothetical protein
MQTEILKLIKVLKNLLKITKIKVHKIIKYKNIQKEIYYYFIL